MTQALATGDGLRHRWQRDDARYYEVLFQPDLFGWVVIRVWGRVGSRLGQVRTTPVSSYQEGQRLVAEISRKRHARQYRLIRTAGAAPAMI